MNRLEQKYKEVVTPSLMKKFNYKSVMEVPHVDKIVINMGIGEAISNPKVLDEAVAELAQITGQAPVITKAKKSIANFKLREGMPIGRKPRYEFIILPERTETMKILSHTLYTPTSIYRMEKCGIHAAQFLFFSADGKPANFICL